MILFCQIKAKRLNFPFSKDDSSWPIGIWCTEKCYSRFRPNFKKRNNHTPSNNVFRWMLIVRFHNTGIARPLKASDGPPLCPTDPVDKVRQFVTPCKKTIPFLLSPRLCKHPFQKCDALCKNGNHITSRTSTCIWQRPTGQADWCDMDMWYGRIRNVFAANYVVPWSRTRDTYWVYVSHRVTVTCKERRGGGGKKALLFIWHNKITKINVVYAFI